MLDWMKHKLESRLLGEILITSICRWHHPYGRKWRVIKELLEGETDGLKLNIQKNEDNDIQTYYFTANRWGNNVNSERLYFLGLQNHCSGDCSHEIKRCLLLGRKAMINLDSVFKKQRHYFLYKGLYSQAIACLAVMYGYESWTIKKAEHQRTDAFEVWC